MRMVRKLFAVFSALTALPGAFAQETVDLGGAEKGSANTLIGGLELHELREDREASSLDVYSSYEEAQQLEAEIVQMYREIRAAELSLIQRQTLDRSLESTLTPLSERAEVDEGLLTNSAKDAEAVKQYQDELSIVLRETDAIVANAKELLASFEKEPPAQQELSEAELEEMTPEEIAAMEALAESMTEESASQVQQENAQLQEELEKERSELQEKLQKDLTEVEMNLEEALKEIEAAEELVEAEIEEVEEAIEKQERELAEQKAKDPKKEKELKELKEKREQLVKLDEQVEVTGELVEKVVKDLETMSEDQVEKAEEAVEQLRVALAAVIEVDAEVAEVSEKKEAKEHTEQAVEDVTAAKEAMEAAAQGMAAMDAIEEMLDQMSGGAVLSGDQAIAQQQSLGELANARSGKWLDITDQMRGRNLDEKPVAVPPDQRPPLWENRKQLNGAHSARKVVKASDYSGDWVFIGDWYVLSRYDNAHRANRQKVYPPESILDLDARYLSEDGQMMRWEYASFFPPVIRPYGWEPWKIYYFYTEIFFEEAGEAWLAIGSDDRSDVWINDLPVWHSSNQHKNWSPSEGFRKVYFKKGRNKVLVRLENGHLQLGLSLYMRLDQ
tara:strand:- start:13460 stop:15304 length:1845 start_codon:yes stop_codon:yes gene_type:complete